MKALNTSRTYHSVISVFCLALLLPSLTFAREGANTGGGGDAATEMRIDEIRGDILKWISEGGPNGLQFAYEATPKSYSMTMSKLLAPHAVIIGAVTLAEEAATTDDELKVVVQGQPKACRGFVSRRDGMPHILCNSERFLATSEAAQYRLIHHEFAGLTGLEQNVGASSDYSLSNQITAFLATETVLRLSIKKNAATPSVSCGQHCSIQDFSGAYNLVGPIGRSVCPKTVKITITTGDLNGSWVGSESVDGGLLSIDMGFEGKDSAAYGEDSSQGMLYGIDRQVFVNHPGADRKSWVESKNGYVAATHQMFWKGDDFLEMVGITRHAVQLYRTELRSTANGLLQLSTFATLRDKTPGPYRLVRNCLFSRPSN
jgi:hypothetical protein